jgi:maltose O-acetyltransferase
MTETPSMRERMLAGELYIADDPELAAESARARRLTHQLNMLDPTDAARHRSSHTPWACSQSPWSVATV